MKSSFTRPVLNSPHCQLRGGGARRHPHPRIDVPRASRQAPALLSSTTDKNARSTHTNHSPIFPVHFTDELLTPLDAALKAFLQTQPYVLEERPDPNPTTRTFEITELHDVPMRPRIMAGEVAHHLRASLDLLVYQLLLKEGVDDPERLGTTLRSWSSRTSAP